MTSVRARIVRLALRYLVARATFKGEVPIAERRKALERSAARVRVPRDVTVTSVDANGVAAEWVAVPEAAADRVVYYLHGGAYTTCSPRTHRALAAAISRASGARVLLPDYRLAPEHVFPAAVEDAQTAYRWLLASGIAPEHVVMAGDSAGGGLAVGTAVALRDAGDPLPAGLVLLSPWTDLAGTGVTLRTQARVDPWLSAEGVIPSGRVYLGEADARNPLASPLYAELSGLPPLLIQVGDDEILLDDAIRLADRARAAGVPVTLDIWPGMWHVFQVFLGYMPEPMRAIRRIGDFVREHMGNASTD
jgi:acetyl esterase/lipase